MRTAVIFVLRVASGWLFGMALLGVFGFDRPAFAERASSSTFFVGCAIYLWQLADAPSRSSRRP